MKPPSFPLYVNNILGSGRVAVMTNAQFGAYILLLCHAWNQEDCGLPNDDDVLAAWSRMNGKWPENKGHVLRCFFKKNGRLYNEKLLSCWEDSRKYRENQRVKGAAGGLARAKRVLSRGLTVAKPSLSSESESESESYIEPEIDKDKNAVTPLAYTADFEQFYESYPRKTAKVKAYDAWKKSKRRPELLVLIAAIEKQKQSKQWVEGIIPHPATWLNQERWDDNMGNTATVHPTQQRALYPGEVLKLLTELRSQAQSFKNRFSSEQNHRDVIQSDKQDEYKALCNRIGELEKQVRR